MSFADRYIFRNINYPAFIPAPPSADLGLVIVIPCFDEPDVLQTIESINKCRTPQADVEVFVVVNQSEVSPQTTIEQNSKTVRQLGEWKRDHPHVSFRLHCIVPPLFRKKHAGAGLARKTGMDEAVRRFASIEKNNGVIISLDADTLVEPNYLVEIEQHFERNPRQVGTTIQFQHRVEELDNSRHQQGIELYEKYLHYYKKAMAFTGFPHSIYTVGSAFAVRVDAYVKQGGMNRKQAGEDFYFLHKLAQLGEIGELNSTCVYPSARLSHRVPFGTGPVLTKWLEGDENLRMTYHFQAFQDLKQLFDLLPDFFVATETKIPDLLKLLPETLTTFLLEDGFETALAEIKGNASTLKSFQKRFFLYFNAFKILKYLNFVHSAAYQQQDLDEAFQQLESRIKHTN